MEFLQRLQPLDVLFALLWACVVGWGLQSGVIRQAGMLVGVYVAAVLAGTLYRPAAQFAALALGGQYLPVMEFGAYGLIFVAVFGLVAFVIWRAYPLSRLRRDFGPDNVIGAALAAIWGVLLLIALLTMLRFYVVTPWRGQETAQASTLFQVQASQVAPVLELVAGPLWQVMMPWFPAAVPARL